MKLKYLILGCIALLVVLIITVAIAFTNTSINDDVNYNEKGSFKNTNYTKYTDETDIQRSKKNMKGLFGVYYDKYIAYTAPNNKNIYIVATKQITDTQLLYAHSVLSNYLNADNGYDMDKLANKIADSGSYIVMANGTDGNSSTPMFAICGQPLYYTEVAAPGTDWFMNNNYEHRDATFEEILHFVHDNGIGTTQNPGLFNDYSEEIKTATFNALPTDKSKWGYEGLWAYQVGDQDNRSWLLELENEGSLEQEYLASVIDSYYGLWGAFTEVEGGMWGMYVAKTREEIEIKDPKGYSLLPFFNEYIASMITFDSSLSGDLYLSFDETLPYTYKTQYYKNVRLTGSNDVNVFGNNQDNIFIGNSGNNSFDGVSGNNIVQYDFESTDFTIEHKGNSTTVTNKTTGEVDTLVNIQTVRFQDLDYKIN